MLDSINGTKCSHSPNFFGWAYQMTDLRQLRSRSPQDRPLGQVRGASGLASLRSCDYSGNQSTTLAILHVDRHIASLLHDRSNLVRVFVGRRRYHARDECIPFDLRLACSKIHKAEKSGPGTDGLRVAPSCRPLNSFCATCTLSFKGKWRCRCGCGLTRMQHAIGMRLDYSR
jgi:hypothetical protein